MSRQAPFRLSLKERSPARLSIQPPGGHHIFCATRHFSHSAYRLAIKRPRVPQIDNIFPSNKHRQQHTNRQRFTHIALRTPYANTTLHQALPLTPTTLQPAMNLQDNDFVLFDLPQQFTLDAAQIDERWKALQRQAHPDKFASQGAAAQRLALQWSVRINEARQRLRDPLKRATYLCELHGQAIDAESNTAMPADFLMQQMQWREELDDAQTPAQLQALADSVQQAQTDAFKELAQTIDQQQDLAAAAQQVRRLMFMRRFAQDVQNTQHSRQQQG